MIFDLVELQTNKTLLNLCNLCDEIDWKTVHARIKVNRADERKQIV